METFRFTNFPVYTKAKELYGFVSSISGSVKDYALQDQAKRAALSIVLNIAEGSAKKSDKEFARFLQISLGSVNELFACSELMLSKRFIDKKEFDKLSEECMNIAKQLGGFSKKLQNS